MNKEYQTIQKKPSLIFSIRFLLSVLGFLLTAIQYMQRTNISVAIVCMINNTYLEQQNLNLSLNLNHNNSINYIFAPNLQKTAPVCRYHKANASSRFDGDFTWDKKIQGFVLSSFFYGYLLTQIAGASLSLSFGPKIVLELSIFVGSIFTLLTPLAASWGYMPLIICRFIIGLAHGVVWTAIGSLWPYWAPKDERSTLVGFTSAGSQIGNVIILPLGGFLCVNGFANGWPSIFYVIGIVGIVWCVLWFLLVANSPAEHKFISPKERTYIINETRKSVSTSDKKITPWKGILTSKAFYGLVITHTCSNFGTYLFLTHLPSYMNEVLTFDIKSNGGLSALPYLAFWFFTIASGFLSDKIIQSKKLNITVVRKLFNTIGFVVPMGCMIGLMFVTCQYPYAGVALITIGLAFSGLTYGSGFLVNFTDVGGAFSGMLFGLSNTIGTISGIVAPYLVSMLTKNKLQKEWQIVFIITACVYFVGGLAFVLLGSGETQIWALNNKQTKLQNEEELSPLK